MKNVMLLIAIISIGAASNLQAWGAGKVPPGQAKKWKEHPVFGAGGPPGHKKGKKGHPWGGPPGHKKWHGEQESSAPITIVTPPTPSTAPMEPSAPPLVIVTPSTAPAAPRPPATAPWPSPTPAKASPAKAPSAPREESKSTLAG